MQLLLPLEVGRDGELHPQRGPRNRLHVHGELQLGELVHVLVDSFAQLGHADQLADLDMRFNGEWLQITAIYFATRKKWKKARY